MLLAARYLMRVIVEGTQIVSRAFLQAIRQEIAASQQLATQRALSRGQTSNGTSAGTASTMTVQEALQILNLKSVQDLEGLQKNYEHLFAINDKSKGGSFYIQSKVVRAKETIEREVMRQMEIAKNKQKKSHH